MGKRILTIGGYFYLTLGLLCNQWVLGWLFSPKGRVDEPSSIGAIWLFDIFFIIFGLLTLKKNKTELITNLNLLLWTVVIITPLLGEMMIRTGIALNIKQFKSPDLYLDSNADDDYWKLQRVWQGWNPVFFTKDSFRKFERVDPLLGWTEANITQGNPLGLQEDALKQIDSPNPKILFYGDSFVKGASDKKFEIPKFMNSKIAGIDVVDLGVGGYGTDQVYLMFKETYQKFIHPLILVGILGNDDLDRMVLSVRTSQKPYFIINGMGNLQLKGVPIEKDQKKYFLNHPLSIRSYFFDFVKRRLFPREKNIKMKELIGSKLLDLFKANAENAKDKLLFVLFYPERGLTTTDWQEEFLKGKLNQLGLHYIDTKDFLWQYAHENHLKLSSFYWEHNGHHNNLGNQVIAEGIIKYLKLNSYIK